MHTQARLIYWKTTWTLSQREHWTSVSIERDWNDVNRWALLARLSNMVKQQWDDMPSILRRRRQGLLLRIEATVLWCEMHQPHYSWWWCCMLHLLGWYWVQLAFLGRTVPTFGGWVVDRSMAEHAARQLVTRYFVVLPSCWIGAVSFPNFLRFDIGDPCQKETVVWPFQMLSLSNCPDCLWFGNGSTIIPHQNGCLNSTN